VSGERRFAIVTGAYGAIGNAIALGLVRAGYEVGIVGRNASALAVTAAAIAKRSSGAVVRCLVADLSRRAAIDAIAGEWREPLHVLVNNAATAPARRELTLEGIEVQFATNVLGYLWMTDAFGAALARAAPARVVNVASYWAGDLDMDDLQFERRRYSAGTAYRQSKQCNRMLSSAYAERLAHARIAVNACHSGDVDSKLSNSLGFGGHETPEAGAHTPLWVATDASLEGVSGKYFEHGERKTCPFSADRARVDALLRACEPWLAPA
jgi:NAD(P)-dependent dehydrogenase (short-subunit alcohol dehydrogenase family)